MTPKIIFIHGMFLNPKSWEKWIEYFTARGYECEAPAWPLHEGEPAMLRNNVPAHLGDLSLAAVYSHYADLVSGEATPPVVIGHSMGGLVMQKLAAAGLIRAGVGICSAAPNRMLSVDWGFLRNSASITNPFAGDEPYEMTPELFHKNFGNMMTEDESNAAWEKHALNESRQVLRNIMGEDGQIDTELPHVPFLFVGASDDEIIPNSLVRRNAHAYSDDRSHSEYVEFSTRGHFICGENGWEEVAEHIANWLDSHLAATRS